MSRQAGVSPLGGRAVVALGALLALVPLSIDLYVPALGAMVASLGVPLSTLQLGVAMFLGGLAFGQLLVGALADLHGPSRVLHVGAALYVVSALLAGRITDPDWLLPIRAAQGFGAGAITIFVRATLARAGEISGELHAARDFARASAAMGFVPVVAPGVGALLVTAFSWRVVFAAMAATALLLWAWAVHAGLGRLSSTSVQHARLGLGHVVRGYLVVLLDRGFFQWAAANAALTGALFVYVTGVLPITAQENAFSAFQTGVTFAVVSLGFVIGARAASRLVIRFGTAWLLRQATNCCMATCLVGTFSTAAGPAYPALIIICGFVFYFFYGVAVPLTQAAALRTQPLRAGIAAALLGTLNFGMGGFASLLVGAAGPITTKHCFALALVLCAIGAISVRLRRSDLASPGQPTA